MESRHANIQGNNAATFKGCLRGAREQIKRTENEHKLRLLKVPTSSIQGVDKSSWYPNMVLC